MKVKLIVFFSIIFILSYLMPVRAFAFINRKPLYKLLPLARKIQMMELATESVFRVYVNYWPIAGERLDVSWIGIPDKYKEVYNLGNDLFIVSFSNDKEERILYVFIINQEGEFAINFSGRFEWKGVDISPLPELTEKKIRKNQWIRKHIWLAK